MVPSMLTGRLRASLLALGFALTAPLALGACDGKELTPTEVPEGGLTLRYELQPGAVYSGHVTSRETLGAAGQAVNRRLDFDVTIAVLSSEPNGDAKVRARVSNLSIEWALPPGAATVVNVDDFVKSMTARLEGVEIPFTVTKMGKVKDVPPLPPELNEQESLAANQVIDGLTRAFFVVPEESLNSGSSWTDEDSRGRKGKLGRYSEWKTTNTFDGAYRYAPEGTDPAAVARLIIETDKTEVTTTKEGGHETKLRSKTTALFNVDDGYLTKLEGTDTKYDGPDMSTTKFAANWRQTKSAGAAAPPAPAPAGEVQAITDPCDPDYVGAGVCEDDAATQTITDPCDPDYVGAGVCEETEADAESESESEGDDEGEGEESADDEG